MLYRVIAYIARASVLLPIILLLLRPIKWRKTKGLWVIFVYLIYCFLNEILNSYFNQILHYTNFFLFNIFTIIEHLLLSYYAFCFIKNTLCRRLIVVLSFCFLIWASIHTVNSPHDFDSISSSVGSILLILYSIYYFFEQLRNPSHLFFYSSTEFWVFVAILLYFSGIFFLFTYTENLISNPSFIIQYTLINCSFYILKNILLGVAMYVKENPNDNRFVNFARQPM